METNNKYYTPDKSEYHIGFEYQSLTDPRQPENDIAWSDEELRTEVDMMNVFKYMIEDDFLEHRCKYLDKEDIQSFKFKTHDGKEHIHETDDLLFFVIWNGKDEFGITYNKKEHYIKTIKHFSGLYNMNECWMPINIKNKSELKILLKQLNIYQNV